MGAMEMQGRGRSARRDARHNWARAWLPVVLVGSMLMPPIMHAVLAAPAHHSKAHPAAAPSAIRLGYWLVGADGSVYNFGAKDLGSLPASPAAPIVGSAATTDGRGYWLVGRDGGVFAFGTARYHGSAARMRLQAPVVGIVAVPHSADYWLFTRNGQVLRFGPRGFLRSVNPRLDAVVVGMVAAPDGRGYWLVDRGGSVFAVGSARNYGSTAARHLRTPIAGMAAAPDGRGYWLVGQNGNVFAFGSARFHGSAGHAHLTAPIVAITPTPDGRGYWLTGRDGGIFTFGDAPFAGSMTAELASAPVVSLSITRQGVAAELPRVGYDISQYQCPPAATIPRAREAIAIVQVSGGTFTGAPNPCYRQEAAWAGPNLEAYIYLASLPYPPPAEAMTGPAGTCHANLACQSYNFGWFWARHWIGVAKADHTNPQRWWMDVEAPDQWSANIGSNTLVIEGAMAAVAAAHRPHGIYSTGYQWSHIAAGLPLVGEPLWVPGAGNARGAGSTAAALCNASDTGFAGGVVILVQFGYIGAFPGSYTGSRSAFDQDQACDAWTGKRVPVAAPAPPRLPPPAPPRRHPAPKAAHGHQVRRAPSARPNHRPDQGSAGIRRHLAGLN